MPGWNVHLEAGNRLADRLELPQKSRKEFLFGCLLPDINNGYINHVKAKKHHCETHYAFDHKSSLNFYAENKAEVDAREPIFLGYLFHLYAADIEPSDITDIERILKYELNTSVVDEPYQFYTEQRLEDLIESTIQSFSHDYFGESYA